MQRSHSFRNSRPSQSTGRSGSTLLIVVALMGMLSFLGFVFYTFAAQERANAITFAEDAKVRTAPSIETDTLWDFVLQQIIAGPNDVNFQSVLWGGRHSLLANMFGRDGIPWNGEGVNLVSDPSGQPHVDMNYDGNADGGVYPSLLFFVDSPAANGGIFWGTNKSLATLPTPDSNYNSPDINSVFLSYDGIASDGQTRVLIPSYLRPQYLRSGGTPISQWYNNSVTTTSNLVMRPHPGHVCVDASGNQLTLGGIPLPRFTSILNDQALGLPAYTTLGLRRPFDSSSVFAFMPPDSMPNANTNGTLGVWTPASSQSPYDIDLDVDTDGDGIMDAILMDLGYPPIRRGDGKLVVPLFAISIRDLNGLLNVNATGNLAGNINVNAISATNQLGFRPTGPANAVPDNLSKSNLGLSTYEINIQRALTADPINDVQSNNSEIAKQLFYFLYQFDPTISSPGRSITELANLEWLMLNIGRAQFHLGLASAASTAAQLQNAITDMFAGRNGELTRMRNFLTTVQPTDLPKPGMSVSWAGGAPTNWSPGASPNPDDNVNYNEGESNYPTRWVNPLDFRGTGQRFQRYAFGPDGQPGHASVDDDGNGVVDDFTEEGWIGSDDIVTPLYGKQQELVRSGPLLWPAYSGYHSYNGSGVGSVQWGEQATSPTYYNQLMRGSIWYSLLDDPTESIIDPILMSPKYSAASILSNASTSPNNPVTSDTVFGTDELPFLQGSNMDGRLTDTRSRLAEVMPANLVGASTAPDIRKRLTTVSTDRREFGIASSQVGGQRSWELNPGVAPPFCVFPPSLDWQTNNPYRSELFYYLRQQSSGASPTSSLKLNVNRLLYLNSAGTQYGFGPLPQQTSVTDVAATTARQNMARDLYTMLYTFCQGLDTDYRTSAPPTPAQAKEMAQFAINVVDALDPDEIITAFYYDPDLSSTTGGGWNQIYGLDGAQGTPDDTVVYGVERQLLTFTEAMGIQVMQRADMKDSKLTIFDDSQTPAATGRLYLSFELQNVTPMNITLASPTATAANVTAGTGGDWRVRLVDPTEANQYNVVTFLNDLDNVNNLAQIDGNGNRILTPGQSFSVSSQDGTDKAPDGKYRTSDFRWDAALDGAFERVVPAVSHDGSADTAGGRIVPLTTTNTPQYPTPKCNLDLAWGYGDANTRFVLNVPAGFTASVLGVPAVKMILERRAANGTATGSWIAVDKTTTITFATNTVTPPATDVATPAPVLQSINRKGMTNQDSPLNRSSEKAANPSFNVVSANTNATFWQWQQDRDFASLAELMLVPVCAPGDLTNGRLTNSEFYEDSATQLYPNVAAARFLRPDNPDLSNNGLGTNVGLGNLGNRWYRLFDFLEVPNRGHQHQVVQGIAPAGPIVWGAALPQGIPATFVSPGTPGTTSYTTIPSLTIIGTDNFPLAEPFNLPQFYGWPRTHGLVNLNMIRHPQALLALLDDDQLIVDPRYSGSSASNLNSTDEGANRDWWLNFLISREARATNSVVDPVTGLFVPGTANARPFRSFDSIGVTAASPLDSPLENTVLRSLPIDQAVTPTPNERRRLFEVGMVTEHQGQPVNEVAATVLHPSARYRLLSKLMNNTTTRSNSFAVYVTAQYYEAVEVQTTDVNGNPATAVRIGGKLDDAPVHRGFFVIDRTCAIEQMKVYATNWGGSIPVGANTYSYLPNTDKTGQRVNMNGIRWKDLVLFRQTLN